MILFEGCAQPVLAPSINVSAARVLDRLGISVLRTRGEGCCGALPLHLSESERARVFARRNIDAWWPALQQETEAIVVTASACAGMIKDYPQLLGEDPSYAEKAARVAGLCRDLSEVLAAEDLGPLRTGINSARRVAFHAPCTLQHGQGLKGQVEPLLSGLGFQLTPVPDSHLCCGSAGSYALLQPQLSEQLRERKRKALVSGQPDVIATANIGCLTHLRDPLGPRVMHWIELLDRVEN
jgi:glycolate oxidase iron-sulfur subunit